MPKVPPFCPWPAAAPHGCLQASDQEEGQMAAVDMTTAELPEGFWYSVKTRVLGPPLVTEQLKNQRLPGSAWPGTTCGRGRRAGGGGS
jgi:hypothetical protein